MSDYLHGVEIVEVSDGNRPIATAKAGVIGIIGSAGKGPVNTPVLISGSRRKAATTFGSYQNDGFTLPDGLEGIFDQYGATVVAINVCDPEVHNTTISNQAVQFSKNVGRTSKGYISAVSLTTTAITSVVAFSGNTITLPTGATLGSIKNVSGTVTYVAATDYTAAGQVITRLGGGAIAENASVLVTYAQTLTAGTDYTIDADTGDIRIVSGKVFPSATIPVTFTYVDPTKVTMADVVGGVDGTGKASGVHALAIASSVVYVNPKILIAPGFTHEITAPAEVNAVVSELQGIATKLRAIIYADTPDDAPEDAVRYRMALDDKRVITCYPSVMVLAPDNTHQKRWRSIVRAGATAAAINATDGGFWSTCSNKTVKGIVGVTVPIDAAIDDKESVANYLNGNHVNTIIRLEGFREWGQRTCSSDPLWHFENVVRINDVICESIQVAHLWAVDREITRNLVGSIVENVNSFLRSKVTQGGIYGGRAWADPELNTPESVQAGQLFIDFDFTPYYLAERITFRVHMVNNYITEVFQLAS